MLKRVGKIGLTSVVLLVVALPLAGGAKPKAAKCAVDGSTVFKENCASCHAGGGNTVNEKKPLAGSSKLNSKISFKAYLENPNGHMPYYKHVISDKAALKALYEYCKTLKPGKRA